MNWNNDFKKGYFWGVFITTIVWIISVLIATKF